MKRNRETLWYSAGGVIALLALLIAGNFIVSAFNARVDLTEGDVYTLSPGTKAILSKLEAPVRLRFYYTQGSNAVPVGLKTFAQRVEDLLAEYRRAGNGKVIIDRFNPEPDSDAEDSAALDNVEGQMTNTGEKFYLGLAVSFLDQKASIPVLSPDRERLLEYDITRAIAQVAATKKAVIGVMAGLPVLGRSLNPMTKQQPTEPWVLGSELKRNFDVRRVDIDSKKIDDDIQVLLVIHPRNITEEGEYAIDQFVLRGGKLIAFVDPYAVLRSATGSAESVRRLAGRTVVALYAVQGVGHGAHVEPGRGGPHLRERGGAAAPADAALAQSGGAQPGRHGDEPGGNAARAVRRRVQGQARRGAHANGARAHFEELDAGRSHHRHAFPASLRPAASSLRARNIRSR